MGVHDAIHPRRGPHAQAACSSDLGERSCEKELVQVESVRGILWSYRSSTESKIRHPTRDQSDRECLVLLIDWQGW